MKKMRFFQTAIMIMFVAIFAVSCNDDNVNDTPNSTEKYYTVSLGFGGEIDVDYEPLVRSSENGDIYGIQVYSAPNIELNDGESIAWTRYAYGLFDVVENLSINLLKGYQYKFVATMVKDGKEKLEDNISLPFNIDGNATSGITNKFIYGQYGFQRDYWGLGFGYSALKTGLFMRPNTERYYGECEGYLPGANDSKVKIEMKRTSFGAKVIAQGELAKDGTLEILISDAPRMELNLTDSNQISDIFTFYFVYNAWNVENYSETISVSFNYFRKDGSMLPLGTHDIVFKRNNTTVINVNIEDEGADSGVGLELVEVGEMEESVDTQVTITNGEIDDTDVETNA